MSKSVFCPIPWNFLAIRSNGDLRVCCQANQAANKGILRDSDDNALNAKNTDLVKARNSKLMKSIRAKMLKDEWPEECIRCQGEEKAGLRSRREYEKENWHIENDFALENTTEDGEINEVNFPLRYMDIRFGNNCNLACRMCGPSDSSSWYNDYIKLMGTNEYWDTHGKVILEKNSAGKYNANDYNWYMSNSFWEQMKSLGRRVKHIYMAGGEPLLIEQHFEFLNQCIERGYSKSMILEYNTNLTVINYKITSLWGEFKQVRVGASIDGMREVFEYQRYPAKWNTVYENLLELDKQDKTIVSWLAVTITNYNVFHIPDFIKWKLTESDFLRINSTKKKPIITHHMCHSPKHLNIRSLPDQLKRRVEEIYNELIFWGKENLEEEYKIEALEKIVNGILKYMNDSSYDGEWDVFIDYTKKLDDIRNQDIRKLVPEYNEYFK